MLGKRLDKVKTSIGILYIYSLDYKEMDLILKKKNGLPIDYEKAFNKFLKFTCYPKRSVKKDKLKPSKPILNAKKISLLTAEDKRAIINVYMKYKISKIDPVLILNSNSIVVDFIKCVKEETITPEKISSNTIQKIQEKNKKKI